MTRSAPSGRIRVLHTTRSLRVDGVTQVVLRNLEHRDAAAFEHHLCALRSETALADEARALGIEPVVLGHRGPATAPRTAARLARLLRERRIDVLHCNRTEDLALAGGAARLAGIPVVSTLHWLGRMDEHPEDDAPAARRWLEMHATVALNRALADRIVAVSEAVRRSFASLPGFPVDRVRVVYPGLAMGAAPRVDPEAHAALRRELGLGDAAPVLLNVGRLHAVKGQLGLVPMMRRVRERLPRARLVIAGDGPLRDALGHAIDAAGLGDAIVLAGMRRDVDALLSLSDLLVLASESEAAPLPLFEAMRAGRPVVATAVGGVIELVEPQATGIVVARGDPAAMADAALQILSEPGRAARMGAAARQRGEAHYDIDASVRALEAQYAELAGLAELPRAAGRRAA